MKGVRLAKISGADGVRRPCHSAGRQTAQSDASQPLPLRKTRIENCPNWILRAQRVACAAVRQPGRPLRPRSTSGKPSSRLPPFATLSTPTHKAFLQEKSQSGFCPRARRCPAGNQRPNHERLRLRHSPAWATSGPPWSCFRKGSRTGVRTCEQRATDSSWSIRGSLPAFSGHLLHRVRV